MRRIIDGEQSQNAGQAGGQTDEQTDDEYEVSARRMGLDCLLPIAALGVALGLAGVASVISLTAQAQTPTAPASGAGGAGTCQAYGKGPCCDPAVTAHLSRTAIFSACRESPASYLGEKGSKDTCRYIFKTSAAAAAATAGESFVEVYAPAQKQVPPEPTDPFFAWTRVGRAFVTAKAKSPKVAALLASSTGIWLPGDGFFVSVNASTQVCTRAEAQKLARFVR